MLHLKTYMSIMPEAVFAYLKNAQWNFQSGDLGDISATFVMSL